MPRISTLTAMAIALGLAAAGASALAAPAPEPDPAAELPQGPGRQTVATLCTSCHSAGQIVTQKRSQADWQTVLGRMVDYGLAASPQELAAVNAYLDATLTEPAPPARP